MIDTPDTTSGLLDQHQLAKALGVTPRRVRQMMNDGMTAIGEPGKYRFELAFCRDWMARNVLDHHGGKRPGAGRRPRGGRGGNRAEGTPDGQTTPTTLATHATPLERAIADGLVLERPEDIRALLGKVSAREAATIRSMVASMRHLHELQVEQAKYVLVSDVEARVSRMVTEAASMMEDASRRAADTIAAGMKVDAKARASIEESIRAEFARVRDTLAVRKT